MRREESVPWRRPSVIASANGWPWLTMTMRVTRDSEFDSVSQRLHSNNGLFNSTRGLGVILRIEPISVKDVYCVDCSVYDWLSEWLTDCDCECESLSLWLSLSVAVTWLTQWVTHSHSYPQSRSFSDSLIHWLTWSPPPSSLSAIIHSFHSR